VWTESRKIARRRKSKKKQGNLVDIQVWKGEKCIKTKRTLAAGMTKTSLGNWGHIEG